MKQKSSSQHSLLQEGTFLFGYLGRRQTPLTTYHVQNIDTNEECSFHHKLWEGHRKGWLDNGMAWAETSVWEWYQVHKLFLDSCNKKSNKMLWERLTRFSFTPNIISVATAGCLCNCECHLRWTYGEWTASAIHKHRWAEQMRLDWCNSVSYFSPHRRLFQVV